MYQFLDLTDAQKEDRRLLLDRYALLAQTSALLPLLAIRGYLSVVAIIWQHNGRHVCEVPSSPSHKQRQVELWWQLKKAQSTWRRIQWWLGDPLDVFGSQFWTTGEMLAGGVWLLWLLALTFAQTGDDYLHLTKRFGSVAASQLPLHYLLAVKSPWSPVQILTRSSHETLNSLHQLLGNIIMILLWSHALLYLNFFIAKQLLISKLSQVYVLCGVVGVVAFLGISATSLTITRKRSYRVFYITHVILASSLLPVLYFHVSHIRIYLYEAALIYASGALARAASTTSYNGGIRLLPNTNVIDISIDIPPPRSDSGVCWQAGQHAYLSVAGHPLTRTFRSNPFTIASLGSPDGKIRFMVRVLDGNTTKLAEALIHGDPSQAVKVAVEGPYGVTTHPDRLLRYDRVLLVAGGIGATFIVPIYRQLLADLSPSRGSYRRQKVTFIWTARSLADVAWAIPETDTEQAGFMERSQIFLSRRTSTDEALQETREDVELEERGGLLSNEAESKDEKAHGTLTTYAGRPKLDRVIDQLFRHGVSERVAIMVCGPKSLSRDLRKEAARWVYKGRAVSYWDESFSL